MSNTETRTPAFTVVHRPLPRRAGSIQAFAKNEVPGWLADAGLRPEHLRWFDKEVVVARDTLQARSRDGDSREIGWEHIGAPRTDHGRPSFWHHGERGLFRSPARCCTRLVVRDGALLAVCRAAAEAVRHDTIYAALPGMPTAAAMAALGELLDCQSARKRDPLSASKRDPSLTRGTSPWSSVPEP